MSRDVAGINASEAYILESYCGIGPADAYEANLRQREEIMRRGIAAIQRLTSGRSGN